MKEVDSPSRKTSVPGPEGDVSRERPGPRRRVLMLPGPLRMVAEAKLGPGRSALVLRKRGVRRNATRPNPRVTKPGACVVKGSLRDGKDRVKKEKEPRPRRRTPA